MQMTVREFIAAIQKATAHTDPSTNLSVGLLRHVLEKVSEEDLTKSYREAPIPVHDFGAEAETRTELEKQQSTNNYLCNIVENAYRKKFGKTTAEAFGDGDLWFEKAVAALENAEHEDQAATLRELGKAMTTVIGNIQMMNPGIDLGVAYTDDVLAKLTSSVLALQRDRDQLRVAHHHCKNSVEKLNAEIATKDAALADAAEQLRKRDNTEKLLQDLNDTLSSQGSILRVTPMKPEAEFAIHDHVIYAPTGDAEYNDITYVVEAVDAVKRKLKFVNAIGWYCMDHCKKVKSAADSGFAIGDSVTKKTGGAVYTVEDINVKSREMRFVDCCGWHAMSEFRKV